MESKPSTAFAESSFVPTRRRRRGATHLRPHLHTTTQHQSTCKNQSTNTHCPPSIQISFKQRVQRTRPLLAAVESDSAPPSRAYDPDMRAPALLLALVPLSVFAQDSLHSKIADIAN